MKNKEIMTRLVDTWGPDRTFYILACGCVGLGVGLMLGLLTKEHAIDILEEKENK